MGMSRERISFTFDPRDMLLSLQIGFSFVRAAVACSSLERTSGLEPSSKTTAPRYLKLVTVPSSIPFTFISFWMSLALFFISLVFSALMSILYRVQVLSRLTTRASSSCSSSARASMSSANRRLVIFLSPMLNFPSCSSRASEMIHSRKLLKKVGDRRHPCLTPTDVLNYSALLSSSILYQITSNVLTLPCNILCGRQETRHGMAPRRLVSHLFNSSK